MKRRSISKAISLASLTVWVSPIVTTVFIPVHAQTSTCTENDVVGTWLIATFGLSGGAGEWSGEYVLNEGGSGTTLGHPLNWDIDGAKLSINIDDGTVLVLTLRANCMYVNGTVMLPDGSIYSASGSKG